MPLVPITGSSDSSTVTATVASLTGMVAGKKYMFVSSTNCWIKQGSAILLTCVAQANFADSDYFTLSIDGVPVIYEFDKAGDGVTSGRVQVNISADTTAATCAARLRTAILANQSTLTVTDNTDGTLTISIGDGPIISTTENVANAGFTIAAAAPPASAADGSMYVPANVQVILDGNYGPRLGVIRNSADGSASLTRLLNTI